MISFGNVRTFTGVRGFGGYSSELSHTPDGCVYKFGNSLIDSGMMELIFPQFIRAANHRELDSAPLTIPERLKQSVQLLNAFARTDESIDDDINDQPSKQVEAAKKIEAKVQEALANHVRRTGEFIISNHCFDSRLDMAEKHLLRVYEDLFEFYLHKKEYDEALKLVKHIQHSSGSAQSFAALAHEFFIQQKFDKMFEALAEVTSSSSEITQLLMKVPVEKLAQSFHNIQNKHLKAAIVDALLGLGKVYEARSLISALETSDQTQAYKKLIHYYEIKGETYEVLNIIPLFYHESDKTQEYLKIIDKRLEGVETAADIEPQIASAKDIIVRFYHESDKTKQYKRIINMYLSRENYMGARNTIAMMYHESDKKVEYVRLIDIYLGKKDMASARSIVSQLYHESDKTQEYAKLIGYCMANGDTAHYMEARNIAMCHYHASDKHKALQRIIDAALQKKEFVQFARETAAYISDHKVRMDVLRRIEQTAQA